MNLEHVSAEIQTDQPKRYRTGKDKSTRSAPDRSNFDRNPFTFNPLIDRILLKINAQDLLAAEHVRAYLLDQHRRNCRPNTIRSNGANVTSFLIFLKDSSIDQLQAITREHVASFVEREQDRGLSPNTVSTQLRCLYAFINFLIDRDVLHPDLLKRKLRIKVPDALPRAIDPVDIKQLLAVVKKPRDRALVLTLLRTGMRIGELLSTRVEDLNLREHFIQIIEAQKNRVGRIVYLSDDARRALKEMAEHQEKTKRFHLLRQLRSPLELCGCPSEVQRLSAKIRTGPQGIYPTLPAAHLCHRTAQRRDAAAVPAGASGAQLHRNDPPLCPADRQHAPGTILQSHGHHRKGRTPWTLPTRLSTTVGS